ncbi:hypothetical protein SUNI508_02869 [Seiridium unicorne]|uniref:Uncharacterized protein n=1 Tax=Seiridium unicorne TaxID=138068 RepID=A0ABR2VHK9_9PEZI
MATSDLGGRHGENRPQSSDAVNWGKYLREEGFVDMTEQHLFLPTSPWCKGVEAKTWWLILQQNMLLGMSAAGLPIAKVLGWFKEQYDELVESAKADILNTDIHSYITTYVVYGRKPLGTSATRERG